MYSAALWLCARMPSCQHAAWKRVRAAAAIEGVSPAYYHRSARHIRGTPRLPPATSCLPLMPPHLRDRAYQQHTHTLQHSRGIKHIMYGWILRGIGIAQRAA